MGTHKFLAGILGVVASLASVELACKSQGNVRPRTSRATANTLPAIIKKDSVQFDRSAERDSGILSFETTVAVYCELRYWISAAEKPPNEAEPLLVPCNSGEASQEFSITVDSLKIDASYSFSILLWENEKDRGTKVRIDEKSDQAETEISELAIAKVLVPQQAAEIYTHKLATPLSLAALQDAIARPMKCATGGDNTAAFGAEDSPNNIKILSVDGFARANAEVHPSYPNRLQFLFATPQFGLNLKWAFQWKNKQTSFSSLGPGYLDAFRIVNKETTRVMPTKNLNDAFVAISVSQANDLSFEWVPKNSTANSSLVVKFLGESTKYIVECRFPSASGGAKIPNDIFASMPNDKYSVLAIFEATQIVSHQDPELPIWLIKSIDWRFAQVTKI